MSVASDKSRAERGGIGETVKVVVQALLLALIVRTLLFQPFNIPSGSMKDTLLIGDYLFVSKFSYGYSRFSFPLGLPLFKGRLFETKPERGDVVVFRLPTNTNVDYIKRVIGLPGDTIQMKHDRLYINGELVEQTRRGEVNVMSSNGEMRSLPRFEEVLPGGRTHIVLDELPNGPADNTDIYTVPEGHYFMMGDNRDNSQDSRYQKEVGFVPIENIVGHAKLILLSFDTAVPLWHVWEWPNAFRAGRWFKSIQ